MTKALPSRLSFFMLVGVLSLAVLSVIPGGRPSLPGELRVAVVPPPTISGSDQALAGIGDWLGASLDRPVRMESIGVEEFEANRELYDLALLPRRLALRWEGSELLAQARSLGQAGPASRSWLVWKGADPTLATRLLVGDPWRWDAAGIDSWLQGAGIQPQARQFGNDAFDHATALAALRHGAVDMVLTEGGAVERARREGWLRSPEFGTRPIELPGPGLVLAASPALDTDGRQKVREVVLSLDHQRFEPGDLRASLGLHALARLGLGPFAPLHPLPSLRR